MLVPYIKFTLFRKTSIEYLTTTSGAQVLVLRADTGSGKTTFLNTLPHHIHDVQLFIQTIDLQVLTDEQFGDVLRQMPTKANVINLFVLEGREKPASINDHYIQVVLANINRFARSKHIPMLFVIPTIDEQVARLWCEHGMKVGDLIPQQKLYSGAHWYSFPGVPKNKYIEIAEETVRVLNAPHNLVDFGISTQELKEWVDVAPTIGRFIEIVANRISDRRRASKLHYRGRKEHVWVIYCSPDIRHYDHTFLVIDGLVQDDKLVVSPTKLVTNTDTTLSNFWRPDPQWQKLINTLNFLDVRLINLPIITAVTSALTYGDEALLASFKRTKLGEYRDYIIEERGTADADIDWEQPLSERRLQVKNAIDSMERTNLFRLLKGLPAEEQRGGVPESPKVLAQYRHLRDKAPETEIHYYLGRTLQDLLEYNQFHGFVGIETESPFVAGEASPIPDIIVHTETDIYGLELHFLRKQITSSELSRYALTKVIEKYMKGLSHLSSLLEAIQ